MHFFLKVGVGFLAFAGFALGSSNTPTAKTKNGTYYGTHTSKWHQDYFQGIPYALPPVGDLRFRDPQPLNKTWTGVKNATELGYMCYGYGATQTVLGEYVSEDCLTLNIYRSSSTKSTKLLPVIVYIHGGLFKHGSGRDPRYNMTSLLQVGVQNNQEFIGVTLNYRLSYWGFLFGNEVAEENVANLGLKDQRLALHWIQENIKGFGGDPEKVTIWGQEAGAFSVGLQLIAYGGRNDGLFRAAVEQSGSPTLMWPSISADQWQPLYDNFLNATGCSDSFNSLECLRGVDAEVLSEAFQEDFTEDYPPNPVVDGNFIQDLGSKELTAGNFAKVPLLIGTTEDEGTWSYYGVKNINTTQDFLEMVSFDGIKGSAARKVANLYPDDPNQGIPSTLAGRPGNETGLGQQWKRASTYNGDKVMQAGRRLASESWAQQGVDVYTYVFDVLFHAWWWQYGSQEQDDVAFFFHNVTLSESLSPDDQADQKKTFEPLSYLIASSLLSFVDTLDPNNAPFNISSSWPKYTTQNPSMRVFDVNATELCRTEKDDFRIDAISHWHKMFMTSDYPK